MGTQKCFVVMHYRLGVSRKTQSNTEREAKH